MGEMVRAIFGGGGNKQAEAETRRAREQQQIAQARQEEAVRAQEAETNAQTRASGRQARGRRLLIATEAGGLAATLGG